LKCLVRTPFRLKLSQSDKPDFNLLALTENRRT
jgi:hypothetical protein